MALQDEQHQSNVSRRSMIKFFRDIALYGSGDFIARTVGVLMMAVLARSVPTAELGVYVAIMAASGPLSLAISFGGETTYTRYYFDGDFSASRASLTTSWICWLTAVGICYTAFVITWRGTLSTLLTGSQEHEFSVAVGLVLVPLVVISQSLGQIHRNRGEPLLFNSFSIGTALLSAALGILYILGLRLGVPGYLSAIGMATLAVLPIRLWAVRTLFFGHLSPNLIVRILPFGLGIALAAVGPMVLNFSDRLLVGKILGLEHLGQYGIAATIGSIMAFISIAVVQAWQPVILMKWQEEPQEASSMAARSATLLCLVFAIAALSLIAFAEQLVLLLAGPAYAGAATAVPGLVIGAAFYGMSAISTLGLVLTKKSGRLAMLSGLAALIGLLAHVVLIPRFGIVGASWAYALGYLSYIMLTGITSQSVWPLNFESRRIAGLVLLLVIFTILSQLYEVHHYFWDTVLNGLVVTTFAILGALIAGVSPRNILAIARLK